jgi:hypothetical protein
MRHLVAILLSLTLATATTAVAQPTLAQAPDWQKTLGGLLTGNQDRDDAVRQAYERGYQRGRNDEARQQRTREPQNRPYDDRSGYYRDRSGYR